MIHVGRLSVDVSGYLENVSFFNKSIFGQWMWDIPQKFYWKLLGNLIVKKSDFCTKNTK